MKKIIEKLNNLRKLDEKLSVFGADSHEYILNPVLSEDEVLKFEREHGITIPEDYRQFILTVGNGGAGPFYGLMKLEDNDENKPDLSKPFEYTKEEPFMIMNMYEEIEEQLEEYEDEDEQDEAREALLNDMYKKCDRGIIFLAHEGCGMYSVLVANGEEYGNVWYFDLANDAGIFPLSKAETGEPMKFTDWYEVWLDRVTEECINGKDKVWGYTDFIKDIE